MRRSALLLLVLAFLVSACDPSGLPVTPTPTVGPVATSALPPTSTSQPDYTPVPLPSNPADIPTPTIEANQPEASVKPAPRATTAADSQELQRELSEVESETVEIRGLPPKADVQEKFIPQTEMKANLTEEVKQDYTPEDGKRDATTLWLMRLLNDRATDLYQLQIDLLGERVLGYYDQKKKDLFVLSNQTNLSPLSRKTLAHEFTHSVQDQYYDLQKLLPDKVENDRGNAVLALVEGDAEATAFAFVRKFMSTGEQQQLDAESSKVPSNVLDRTPPYVRDTLIFPYTQGPSFIVALARSQPGSFNAINDALANPPDTTEQILHPEKFLSNPREEALPVTLAPLTDTLGAGWTYKDGDTLGELDFKLMLQENGVIDPTASEGWGGARYSLYVNGDAALVYMQTRWDTNNDAVEFSDAMQQSLGKFTKNNGLWSDGKRTFGLKRSGDAVTVISSTDPAETQKVLASVQP